MMSSIYVFPGQGSQSVGMLADYIEQFAVVRETVEQASQVLGYDIAELMLNGPEDKLNQTQVTQPAVLVASVALWRAIQDNLGGSELPQPSYMAGHSLGEYSALVCSGALEFESAVALVAVRAGLMQGAVPVGEGGMAAILGLPDDEVVSICAEITADANHGVIEAVNFNSPGQVVIAGNHDLLESACAALKAGGAKRAALLSVSVPAHSSLMKTAAGEFEQALNEAELKMPNLPLIQNVTARPAQNVAELRANLVQQLFSPVKWTDSVRWAAEQGVDTVVECGPGKVLSGLTKRIDKSLQSVSLSRADSILNT
ncbi:malonyl CoA-acyl carrier protein transacylase [Oleiphilus messinensis]|uniref:Malonyl CoA-acyl carrier protein transacylase n=2 Tax=Oleiphilus messinensis TaxID=141451 RepID=A0A1Y0I7T9_9GAMM|nr:ACP S-malonyltransferase [Oleiphilus messinensis]ARU56290.1 malonyl CoA-acyl carrier protein transacylase [Oleiphilus messinensis]